MKKDPLKSDTTSVRLTRGQIFLAQLTLVVLAVMTFSTFTASHVSAKQGEILTAAETSSASIIFAQREALVYTVEIEQWIRGSLPRQDVERTRVLLAKRLNTFDSSGTSVGSLANPLFLQALKAADTVIQKSPQGFLPIRLRATTEDEIAPIVENIVNFAAELVISFQKAIDVKLRLVTLERANITTRNLLLRYLLLLLTLILVFWVGITFSARYKSIQDSIKTHYRNIIWSTPFHRGCNQFI